MSMLKKNESLMREITKCTPDHPEGIFSVIPVSYQISRRAGAPYGYRWLGQRERVLLATVVVHKRIPFDKLRTGLLNDRMGCSE
jgi:hypothetical protein